VNEVYHKIKEIEFKDMHYRTDIGFEAAQFED
jgi:phosphoribosylamine-glycine ligase